MPRPFSILTGVRSPHKEFIPDKSDMSCQDVISLFHAKLHGMARIGSKVLFISNHSAAYHVIICYKGIGLTYCLTCRCLHNRTMDSCCRFTQFLKTHRYNDVNKS